eukprot:g2212.t1
MVKAAYVHTGDIEDTGAGSKEMEMETLQAAAAMARTEAEQRRRYSEILRLQTDNTPARRAATRMCAARNMHRVRTWRWMN